MGDRRNSEFGPLVAAPFLWRAEVVSSLREQGVDALLGRRVARRLSELCAGRYRLPDIAARPAPHRTIELSSRPGGPEPESWHLVVEGVIAALHGGDLAAAFLRRAEAGHGAAHAEEAYDKARRSASQRTLADEVRAVWRSAIAAAGDQAAVLSGVRHSACGTTAVRADLPNAWTTDPFVGMALEAALTERIGIEVSVLLLDAEMLITTRCSPDANQS